MSLKSSFWANLSTFSTSTFLKLSRRIKTGLKAPDSVIREYHGKKGFLANHNSVK